MAKTDRPHITMDEAGRRLGMHQGQVRQWVEVDYVESFRIARDQGHRYSPKPDGG